MNLTTAKDELILDALAMGRLSVDGNGNVYGPSGKKIIRRCRKGYIRVALKFSDHHVDFFAHRIVWIAYHGLIAENLQVNHIDGNKQNNFIENLELTTCKENVTHAVKMGLHNSFGYKQKGKRQISAYTVQEVEIKSKMGLNQFEIAEDLHISQSSVSRILRGKCAGCQ